MYTTKANCKYCRVDIIHQHEDKYESERLLMQKYIQHINSEDHKKVESLYKDNQYTSLVSKSTCECGEVIEVKSRDYKVKEIKGEVGDKVKSGIERQLLNKLQDHRQSSSCKKIRRRDSKIDSILGI